MNSSQIKVERFMELAEQQVPPYPTIPDKATQVLRVKLHEEEAVKELAEAFDDNDIYAVADSLADSLVVVLGTAAACGIAIEPIFNEVMKSNMTKFIDGYRSDGTDGNPVGKWIKGPSYTPANIKAVLDKQMLDNEKEIIPPQAN